MSHDMAGRAVLVTGAASGLGRAIASRFLAAGAAVACVDRQEDAVQAFAANARTSGGASIAVTADVTSSESMESAVQQTLQEFGRIDVVIANAGIPGAGEAHTVSEDDWDRVVAINLKGVWLTSRYVLPHMIERGSGVIINQASMAALVGLPGIFPYTAAKGGVAAMTKQMAIAYGEHNIRVNAICPGTVLTPLVVESRKLRGMGDVPVEEMNKITATRFPLGRMGEPEDIANLTHFLSSDEASWITGGVFPVDGGRSAM